MAGKRVLVALSGGVDSGALAWVAKDAGAEVTGVTLHTPFNIAHDVEDATKVAEEVGIRHVVVPVKNGIHSVLAANQEDRCYFCKKKIYSRLETVARDFDVDLVVDGTNVDDVGGSAGYKARVEHPIGAPWLEFGFHKSEIREVARSAGLSFWNKSSRRCLAVRIAHGLEITHERLAMVERAEAALASWAGTSDVGLTLHPGDLARIQVPPRLGSEFVDGRLGELVETLTGMGIRHVCLDLGSLLPGRPGQPPSTAVSLRRTTSS